MDLDQGQEGLKNRDAFTRQETRMGMPAGVFMAGIVIVFASYFVVKTFLAPILLGAVYFPLMFTIHKNDSRALKIWVACMFDKTDCWQAGSVNEINLILNENKE